MCVRVKLKAESQEPVTSEDHRRPDQTLKASGTDMLWSKREINLEEGKRLVQRGRIVWNTGKTITHQGQVHASYIYIMFFLKLRSTRPSSKIWFLQRDRKSSKV